MENNFKDNQLSKIKFYLNSKIIFKREMFFICLIYINRMYIRLQ